MQSCVWSSDYLKGMMFAELVERLGKEMKHRNSLDDIIHDLNSCEVVSIKDEFELNKLVETVNEVIEYGSVPVVTEGQDRDLDISDFPNVSAHSATSLKCLLAVTSKLVDQEKSRAELAPLIKRIIVPALVLVAQHMGNGIWTNINCKQLASDILSNLLKLTGVDTVQELLCGTTSQETYILFPQGVAKHCLVLILPALSKSTWLSNPGKVEAFRYLLNNIVFPHTSLFLNELLPPALVFSDHHMLANKLLGVKCLRHIIDNVTPTQLNQFGRSLVVYNALEHLSYSREAELISAVHPCLAVLIGGVDEDVRKSVSTSKMARFGEVYHRVLTEMEGEQRISLREAYSGVLKLYIKKMGITIVKWLSRTINVIMSYLEVYEGPEGNSHKNCLEALEVLISVAWPRFPYHMGTVIKGLLRFLYDVSDDSIQPSTERRQELVNLAVNSLMLLKATDPEKFMDLWHPILSVSLDVHPVSSILKRVK